MQPKTVLHDGYEWTVAELTAILAETGTPVSLAAVRKRLQRGWTVQQVLAGRAAPDRLARPWRKAGLQDRAAYHFRQAERHMAIYGRIKAELDALALEHADRERPCPDI